MSATASSSSSSANDGDDAKLIADGKQFAVNKKLRKRKPRKGGDVVDIEQGSEASMESEHVHSVYSAIASHFSETRYKPWPMVVEFLERHVPAHGCVADVGCGNGKYLGVLPANRAFVLGSDRCAELCQIAGRRGHEALVGDSLTLPFRDGAFDAAISIAVLHHFASVERRLRAVDELLRIVKPGGYVLVTAWAFEQSSRVFEQQDTLVPWHLRTASSGNTDVGLYHRFYHVYKQGELDQLFLQAEPTVDIVNSQFDNDNWYVAVQKSQNSE
jgi:tRNA (uracil-5-)-methyltransferase TRM9